MFHTPAKLAREHVARAGRDLLKGEMPRAVGFCCEALKIMAEGSIMGREKFEVEVHIQEFLKEFNNHPEVRSYFSAKGVHSTPFVRYARGAEREVLGKLTAMLSDLKHLESRAAEEGEQRKAEEVQKALDYGQQLLESNELPKAKSVLKRLVEKYPKDNAVKIEVAGRLLKAGLFFESGEIAELAVAENPRDSQALSLAVQSYRGAKELTKVEALYKHALKTFGVHPRTLMHLAELYLEMNRWDDAYNFAKQALDGDASLERAKAIMAETEKRLF